jgi:hypothetical protein
MLRTMRTTIDLPDALYRRAKAAAALRGESLKALVSAALRAHLGRLGRTPDREPGWRRVFGKADASDLAGVDRLIEEEFGKVIPEDWE